MNKIVKRELEKIRANITYDDSTTHIVIPKQVTPPESVDIKVNHNYNIYVEDYILKQPSNFSLSTNWNNGVVPISKYMNICVIQRLSNMIQVDACGYDVISQRTKSDSYMGLWLPVESIHIIKEI